MKKKIYLIATLIVIALVYLVASSMMGSQSAKDTLTQESTIQAEKPQTDGSGILVEKNGSYTSKEEVACYIHTYGTLPDNFITKKDAEELGWDSGEGNLDEVAPGKSIGGSRFGNYEGQLPKGSYKECDIDYTGGYRGAARIVYSEDGAVYYTEDHYKTFEQLY